MIFPNPKNRCRVGSNMSENQNGTHSRAANYLCSPFFFSLSPFLLFLSFVLLAGTLSALPPAGHSLPLSSLRLSLLSDPSAEGGGFFSSSASGYSNGLALLLLGQKNDEKPIRVSPWSHYHLVVEETDDTRFQLASSKNWLSRRCTSLICFGRKSERPENPSPTRAGRNFRCEGKRDDDAAPSVDYNCEVSNRFALKSSLKKRSFSDVVLADDDASRDGVMDHTDRRKVQWPDTCGGIEIAEVREFEPSEVDESEDEFHHGSGKSCMCTIM